MVRFIFWLLFHPNRLDQPSVPAGKPRPAQGCSHLCLGRAPGPGDPLREPWGRLLHLGRLEEGNAGGNAGGGGSVKAPSSRQGQGLSFCILSAFHPPSTCPRPPLRRRCCSGAAFWITRCCCPLAKPSSAKSLAGSAWFSLTRPTGFAWVSGPPPNCVLHSALPLLASPVAPAARACLSPPTQHPC